MSSAFIHCSFASLYKWSSYAYHTVGVIYDTVHMEVAITLNWCDKHFKMSYTTPHFMCSVEQVNFVICMTYSNNGELLQNMGDEWHLFAHAMDQWAHY